jgi:undecaprenyl diphosphate synthase
VTRACRRVGVQALTLYAFSSQNWSRPPDEVAGLMDLLREYLLKEREELLENQIRLNAMGELDRLPKYVREPLEALRAETAGQTGMTLTLALSYGGRSQGSSRPRPSASTNWRSGCGRRACRRSISSSAPRVSSGCRTSCSGRRPTPS